MKIKAALTLASLLTAEAAVAGGFSFDVLFKFDRGAADSRFAVRPGNRAQHCSRCRSRWQALVH